MTADPGLTPLQCNGGLTLTHALLPFAPALNGGNNDWVATDDQDLDQDLDAADKIRGTGYADLLDGLAGADVLTGLGGPDRFRFRQTHSTLAAPDRISDFLIGTDKISLLTAAGRRLPTPVGFSRAADNASAKTLAQLANDVFADANGADPGAQALGANRAAVVVATHSAIAGTYVLVNDGTAALSGSNDILINLRGHLGVLPAPWIIVPSLFFG